MAALSPSSQPFRDTGCSQVPDLQCVTEKGEPSSLLSIFSRAIYWSYPVCPSQGDSRSVSLSFPPRRVSKAALTALKAMFSSWKKGNSSRLLNLEPCLLAFCTRAVCVCVTLCERGCRYLLSLMEAGRGFARPPRHVQPGAALLFFSAWQVPGPHR